MNLTAWRICKKRFARDIWTGQGARKFGGRWNSRGIPVMYASQSLSLATVEILVHLDSDEVLTTFVKGSITFDRSMVESIALKSLPTNWRAESPPPSLRRIGDKWIAQGRSAVLAVPSVIVTQEWNYLISPAHDDFSKIRIGRVKPFRLDPRLA